jgi:hypothetical protein
MVAGPSSMAKRLSSTDVFCIREMLGERPAPFAPISANQIGAGTAFEVKCLLAIDAIAAVYGADWPRSGNGSARKWLKDDSPEGLLVFTPGLGTRFPEASLVPKRGQI